MGLPFTTSKTDQILLDWVQLSRTEGIGPITFKRLLQRYGSADRALEALPDMAKRGGKIKKPFERARAEQEIQDILKLKGQILIWQDNLYPDRLKHIEDAPAVLTVFGNTDLLNQPQIGIVGARNASAVAQRLTKDLARACTDNNIVVTSGLARGIDTAAHAGAVDQGKTIAVVAGGPDVIYPKENTELYKQIRKHGAVVSENAIGVQPTARHFPRRNRIVSGLSRSILVVEATLRSGSLITARLAGEQGRDVMAIPGFPADPRAMGPNKLLKDGAILIENIDDILEHFKNSESKPFMLSDGANDDFDTLSNLKDIDLGVDIHDRVLSALSFTPMHIDELTRALEIDIAQMQIALLDLEISGDVVRHTGGRISKG